MVSLSGVRDVAEAWHFLIVTDPLGHRRNKRSSWQRYQPIKTFLAIPLSDPD